MDNFLKYFYQDVGRVFRAFLDIFASFFNFVNYLFNFPMRLKLIREYNGSFSTGEWIMLIITELVLVAIAVGIIILLIKLCKKLFRFRVPVKKYDEMTKQVRQLQRDLLRANYEKDKLLAMKVAELGGDKQAVLDELGDLPEENEQEKADGGEDENFNPNRNTFKSPCVDPNASRFFRLTTVDNFYKTQYVPPVYDNDITLPEFCDRFRRYAASQLHLYYDLNMMR